MQTFLDRAAAWIVDRRWWVVVAALAVAAAFATRLPEVRADFTPSDLFATFEEQEEVARDFREAFGHTDDVLLVLLEGDDVLRGDSLEYLHRLSLYSTGRPGTDRVESPTISPIPRSLSNRPDSRAAPSGSAGGGGALFGALHTLEQMAAGGVRVGRVVEGQTVEPDEARRLRRALEDSPLIEGRLISEDRTLAAVAVIFDESVETNADLERAVRQFEQWLEAHPPPAGSQARLAGLPFVRTAVIRRMRGDQTVMLPAAIIVSLLLLFVAFRWLPAVLLPLLAVVLSTVTVVGGMAALDEPFNVVNNIVPLLVVVIGLSDAIHLIHRYVEDYAASGRRSLAARSALRQMLVACFLTTFTTAAGFGSLAVSNTDILRRFGLTAAAAILVVYVATVTLIPALLPAFDDPGGRPGADGTDWVESTIGSLAQTTLGRPAAAGVVVVGPVVASLAWFGLPEVDNAVLDQLDADDPVYRTTRLIEEKLVGVRPLEISFRADREGRLLAPSFLNRVDDLQRWADGQEPVLQTLGPTDYLHEAWYLSTGDGSRRRARFPNRRAVEGLAAMFEQTPANPLERYLTADRRRARLTVELADVGARRTLDFAERLRRRAGELFGDLEGVTFEFTGDAYVGSKGLEVVIRDLLWSVGLAFVIIFGVLTLVLRDLRLGLISVLPNVLPLFVALAYMSASEIPINAATAIIFSVSIGLAVDGTIHLLARFREEADRRTDLREAIVVSVRRTGRAIALMYVALMIGFSVMLTSSFVPVRRFGELITVTVAGCLVATLVLLPPLLRLARVRDE